MNRDVRHRCVRLGRVWCNFVSMGEFLRLCRHWLDQGRFHHVVTLNPEMVVQAEHDRAFDKAVAMADLRIPDGAGLMWARWYLRSPYLTFILSLMAFPLLTIKRVTGVDAVKQLAQLCAKQHKSLYLLGGTKYQVKETARCLHKRHPALIIHVAREHDYDVSGPADILTDIVTKQPDVLLVAYGAPKQTIWIERHRVTLRKTQIAMGVGGAFAMLSANRPRAPGMWRRLNLEWLWRLALEPTRLPRIWQAIVKFPLLIRRQKKAG